MKKDDQRLSAGIEDDLSRNVGSDVAISDNSAQMTKRPNIETLAEVADRLMAVRSSLNPNQHEFMWNELTLLAQDVRRLSGAEPQSASVPEGYALVPLIPTQEMIEVGCENNSTQWNEGTDLGFAADVALDVYVSMVRTASQVSRPK